MEYCPQVFKFVHNAFGKGVRWLKRQFIHRFVRYSISVSYTHLDVYKRQSEIPLHWIGNTPQQNKAVSLGVPFNEGELYPEHTLQLMTDKGEMLPTDTWALAYWPDGSVKWKGIAGVIPKNTEKLLLKKTGKKSKEKASSRTRCV